MLHLGSVWAIMQPVQMRNRPMPKISCVKLFKRIKINEKWILAQALFDSKGRLRRDHVRVQEKDEIHPEGSYFIEWWDRGKVTAKRSGLMAFRPPTRPERSRPNSPPFATEFSPHPLFRPPELERTTVAEAIERYSEYIKYHRSLRTFRTYRPILASFKSFCTRSYIDDVDRDDLLAFATHCMKQGQKGKSVYNKLVVLSQVLKQHGKPKVVNTADWPRFVETVRPIYEDSDLTKLFKTCTPTEEARFKFYLMSGFRDAEGRFVRGAMWILSTRPCELQPSRTGAFIQRTGRSGRFRCRRS
jgi:integrase/recombinase XerD